MLPELVLRDHRDRSDTFIKVIGAGAGMGAGTKNYTAVLAFQTKAALEGFLGKGWELSGQALVQGFEYWVDPKLNE